MHRKDEIEINKCVQFVNNNLRDHCFKYYKEVNRLLLQEHIFFNRIVILWNSLPNEVVTTLSVVSITVNVCLTTHSLA